MKLSEIEKATSPNYSAWISASAGTGKTKLLTDRIVNLLITGVAAESIICITFTNAAKGEMVSRINASLKALESISKEQIFNLLEKLQIEPNKINIEKIRNLSNNYNISSEKVQIFTIHGFCQSILKRFPIESGIKPNFQVLSDTTRTIIIEEILSSEQFIAQIAPELSSQFTFYSLREILNLYLDFFAKNSSKLEGINYDYNSIVYDILHIDKSQNPEELLAKKIKQVSQLLKTYNNSGISFIDFLYTENFSKDAISQVFFTKNLEPRKKIITKDLKNKFPKLEDLLLNIQNDLSKIYKQYAQQEFAKLNSSLLKLAYFLNDSYIAKKTNSNLLDYDDLIKLCHKLICNSDIREWIKFKLDQDFDHILVDESQDTSESQWMIIKSLIEDFFAGDISYKNKNRTIFVVGDVKQSIYAFQGARPDLFIETMFNIKSRADASKSKYIETSLRKTYRTPSLISNYIREVFNETKLIEQVYELECHRENIHSSIEIWDLEKDNEIGDQKLFWPSPDEVRMVDNKQKKLAKKIATYIKETLDTGLYIDSKQRPIKASDFMILLQKRSSFNRYLYEEIQNLNIAISGLDRIILNESLIVKDILSALKYVIDPTDELNFFSLLKSEFFNLNDNEIYQIIKQNKPLEINLLSDLEYIKYTYSTSSLYEFILKLITHFDVYSKLYTKSAKEEIDVLNSFLDEIMSLFAVSPDTSAISILNLFETTEINVKRDFSLMDAVKINTVHGAKGLESPIVIIADSNYYSIDNKYKLLEYLHNQQKFPILYKQINSDIINSLLDSNHLKDYEEYLRLLYVALTRAQDHLLICGVENKNENNRPSWYDLCRQAIQKISSSIQDPLKISSNAPQYINAATIAKPHPELEHKQIRNTVIKVKDNSRKKFHFNKGTIIGNKTHKELEFLASIQDFNISKSLASASLFGFFNNKEIMRIFKLKKLAEAEIIDISSGKENVLRIDLLAIDEENKEIIILDYKTDNKISDIYNPKLKEYHLAVQNIYSGHIIKTYIYWIKQNLLQPIHITN